MDFTSYITYIQKYYPTIVCKNITLIDENLLGIISDSGEKYIGLKSNGKLCKVYMPKKDINDIPNIKGNTKELLKNIHKIKNTKNVMNIQGDFKHNILYDNHKILPINNTITDIQIENIKAEYNDKVVNIEKCQEKFIYEKEKIIKGISDYKEKINTYLKNIDKNCDVEINKVYEKMNKENDILKNQIELLQKQSYLCKDGKQELLDNSNDIHIELDKVLKELDLYKMKLKVIDGYKERCQSKILNEKKIIIDKIKEYNEKWENWYKKANINIEENINIKNNIIKDYDILKNNLNTVKTDNKKLSQNIKDIKLELKKIINEQIRLLQEKDLIIKEKTEKEILLQEELESVKKMLNENSRISIPFDYENCNATLKYFITLNNIFWRKAEIIKKIDKIIGDADDKQNKNYQNIKSEILQYIQYLELEKYINSPNIHYLKSNSTKSKVPIEFCNELSDILKYWNENIKLFQIQDQKLLNIYEDLTGAVRVYIRIKPLIGQEQKSINSLTITEESLNINCQGKVREFDFNMENIYNETYLNINIITGNNKIISNDSLIIDESQVEITGMYNKFKQLESGYNVLLFGYGVGGSGKTFSILGNNGIPGLAHYGLANLKNVSNIRIKNVFEQYYSAVDLNFGKIRGKIHNLINIVPQVNLVTTDEQFLFKDLINFDKNNIKITDFAKLINTIEEYRLNNGRIKSTIFNPVSSRSHLYIILEISFENGIVSYLTIIDMAGRESPIDIYNKYINTSKTSLTSIMAPAPIGGVNTIERNMKLQYVDTISPKHILDLIKEGFYINESLNHLIYYFQKLRNKVDKIQIQIESKYNTNNFFVNPKTEEKYINTANNCLTIPILQYISNLSLGKNKTKYIMICNIRQEESFCDQTVSSLEFAMKITK